MAKLQRLALSGDSAEAVQPNELQEHRPCLSPERAILCKCCLVEDDMHAPSGGEAVRSHRTSFTALALHGCCSALYRFHLH